MSGNQGPRARGRSRGRARGSVSSNPQQPGVPPQPIGRGRSRGQQQQQQQQQHQVATPPPARGPDVRMRPRVTQNESAPSADAPTAAMSSLSIGDRSGGEARRRRLVEAASQRVIRPDGSNKTGDDGRPVNLASNFFKFRRMPNQAIYQYHVSFEPDIQSIRLKHALMYELQDVIGRTRNFDGMILFLPNKLPDATTVRTVTTREGNPVTITIAFTNVVPENSPIIVQFVNIKFRKMLQACGYQQIGRNYYHPSHGVDIPAHRLQVWPGVDTSILQYEQDAMLCVDVAHKVLRSQTVLEFLYDLYRDMGNQGYGLGEFYDEAKKRLLGEIVLTRYNNKTYRIDDINWNVHPADTFEKADGSRVTYKEYYETVYQKKVNDGDQPMLVSLPKERDRRRGVPVIHLLPEFCLITGMSDEVRKNFSLMQDLAHHTRVRPAARARMLNDFMGSVNSSPEAQAELTPWNMQFESNLVRLTGRVLPTEDIFQRDESQKIVYDTRGGRDADWSKGMRDKPLKASVNMQKWVLLFSKRDQKTAWEFAKMLRTVCQKMGVNVSEPEWHSLDDPSAKGFFRALSDVRSKDEMIEMVVCIVPNVNKDRYDAIKKFCCLNYPVPSQVVVAKTLNKPSTFMSVCTKVGLQLNCKLGGEAWAVDIPVQSKKSKLMVVGFDVYHDSATKGKSIGGFVASSNRYLTRYYSQITTQTSHQEIADQLKVCMTQAIKHFHDINNAPPDRIIVYRDGVGDGMLNMVMDYEIPQIKAAFKALSINPGFAMIVVKKRISTRLFLEERPGQFNNPLPGTVVDTVVTRPEWLDFFLVSQSVRQGTVTPTHYNVIYDTTRFSANVFQQLTYKLCHLYYNWPGTIRVPAPCQYAHKLAYLVGQSIHSHPHQVLADRLYYL